MKNKKDSKNMNEFFSELLSTLSLSDKKDMSEISGESVFRFQDFFGKFILQSKGEYPSIFDDVSLEFNCVFSYDQFKDMSPEEAFKAGAIWFGLQSLSSFRKYCEEKTICINALKNPTYSLIFSFINKCRPCTIDDISVNCLLDKTDIEKILFSKDGSILFRSYKIGSVSYFYPSDIAKEIFPKNNISEQF